jgi:hypothetical protein
MQPKQFVNAAPRTKISYSAKFVSAVGSEWMHRIGIEKAARHRSKA